MSGARLDPDAAARLDRLGGAKLVRTLIDSFLQHGPERLAAADAALAAGTLREAERAWHMLRASAGNLGASALQQAAAGAEAAAAAGDTEQARRAGRDVAREYHAAAAALTSLSRELGDEDDRAGRG